MKTFGSLFPRTALAAAVAIMAAAPALAQNTTAAVGGRVSTADGRPVAGATVVVLHRESGSVSTLTTDADGRYNARGLRAGGPYTITVSKGGERSVNDEVYLVLAETTIIDLRLGSVQALEQIVVTGSSATSKFKSSTMGSGTQLGRTELDAYASIGRNLQDYARNDPRLSQTDKERGEISAAGQNTRFNSITIDGVRTNDTFGLESNNLPTLKQPISIDAIQAVQVNLSNYDVTQTGYTGANINAVTKSGTNAVKGSVYYVYRDANMAGDRFNRTTGAYTAPPGFKEDTKGFTVGGPIIKDKLFFFASYEKQESSRSSPSFGPVGSSQTNVGITTAQIAAAQAAAGTYGINIGSIDVPQGVALLAKDTLLKLDWNISDRHRFNLRYSKSEESNPIFPGFFADQLTLSSHWYSQDKTLKTLVGQLFSDWTDNFSTELKVSKRDYESVPKNNSNLPQISLVWTTPAPSGTPAGNRTLRFGTEQSRHFNNLATKTLNTYFAGNLTLDKHELKAGFDLEKNEMFNAFLQNTRGVYVFQSADPVAQWLAGTPTSYNVQLPLAGKKLSDGAANWTLNTLGLFLQDTWTVSRKLTLNGGVRIDRISTNDRPIANAVASGPVVAGNPATNTRQSGGFGYDNTHTLDGTKLVQPRVGFNLALDLIDKKKSQLRGGLGLFQGAAASVWLTNPFQNTGAATANFSCSGTGGSACPAALKFSANPDAQPTIVGTPPAANVDFISPNAEQPSVWKANLAFDTELPWYGLNFSAEWLHTKVKDAIYYKYLNLGTVTATAPDGREMYWNAAGRSTNCWTAGGFTPTSGCGSLVKSLNNQNFQNVTLVENTDKGGGNALTLSLSQQVSRGFAWNVAYTRTTATEVSPLTSSVANSNFNSRAIYNPNENVAANSAYLIRNRVNAGMYWSQALIGKYKTTFGVTYEGRDGKPYSWVFGNDMNGDGVGGNDLMYVPKAPGSGEVLFRLQGSANTVANSSAAAEAKFWSIVDGDPALRNSKGAVVGRNEAFSKFTNSIDLRLSQEVPGLFRGTRGVLSLDLQNFGNMLNRRWGRIDEVAFNSAGGNRRTFVNTAGIDAATGKLVYAVGDPTDFTTKQGRGESQWSLQITARYEF